MVFKPNELCSKILNYYSILIDPPEPFSSDNLGHPEITYKEKEEIIAVTLICKVDILNGIEMWQNVSYSVEWFVEGKSIQQETICGGLPIGGVNANPCPGGQLISQLSGKKYKIGQRVRFIISSNLNQSCRTQWGLYTRPSCLLYGKEENSNSFNVANGNLLVLSIFFIFFFIILFFCHQTFLALPYLIENKIKENGEHFCLVCNFFNAKQTRSRWENLDRGQYRFQPIKFVKSVVSSRCETYNKIQYNLAIIYSFRIKIAEGSKGTYRYSNCYLQNPKFNLPQVTFFVSLLFRALLLRPCFKYVYATISNNLYCNNTDLLMWFCSYKYEYYKDSILPGSFISM